MRLSTGAGRDDAAAVALLHAALDAGVDFLDTADAYCRDASETGHNERLIAAALASWPGDRARVVVATKGGLTRPDGRWVADGRARHLTAACAASRRALGVTRIALYQLHAPDPRTPLATSVRALAALQRDGLVERIGLCNVSLRQLEDALRIAPIDAVQVELGVLHDDALWNGVAARCLAERIPLVAYRPLGGYERRAKLARDPALASVAERHGATPFEIALAWLRELSPLVLPIPGATRAESVLSSVRAAAIALDEQDRSVLDERFPGARQLRDERPRPPLVASSAGEVVLVMGLPAAGKSTLTGRWIGAGYERLNRDERGGRLADLVPLLDRALATGQRRVVLDNTYATRKSRAPVVAAAARHGVPVRCVWLQTSLEEAQVNAVSRMRARYGRLLGPDEMRAAARSDPGVFPPGVLFRYERELEPPDAAEGFSAVEPVAFRREPDSSSTKRALVVWLDGVLWRSRSGARAPRRPDDLELVPGRTEILRRHASDGFELLGLSWQPELEAGRTTPAAVAMCCAALGDRLGLPIRVAYCPHGAGPPRCWCRKPLPGLGVEIVRQHRLDPARCVYVGESRLDRTFAKRLGFVYQDAAAFFRGEPRSE
jgi:aryl-alcohol dehydrogenase-like predicted oxidoreductase/histidinol phosphatase-like enzyme/predicted kinase